MKPKGKLNAGQIYDRLYGKIEYTKEELRLFQTREMVRLRQVSLSAVPPWLLPTGTAASKFEHSVGAAHLAKLLGSKAVFSEVERLLYWSCLVHDIGTPPFSHASEYFLMKVLGKTHEEFAEDVLEGSELGAEIERQGGRVDQVVRMVNGDEPVWGGLIKGSIDLDNLDNSLRFGLSMGLLQERAYSPENLVEAYVLNEGKLALKAEFLGEIEAWEAVRQEVYRFVYHKDNSAAAMMLYRALEFAAEAGELDRAYFSMTDAAAFQYLKERCNRLTRELTGKVERWQWFREVYRQDLDCVDAKLKRLFLDTETRSQWSDELAIELGLGREQVSVFLRKDKGYKKIHLPLVSEGGEVAWHLPKEPLIWLVRVYVDPAAEGVEEKVGEFIQSKLWLK